MFDFSEQFLLLYDQCLITAKLKETAVEDALQII